jgi:hypothetical protein
LADFDIAREKHGLEKDAVSSESVRDVNSIYRAAAIPTEQYISNKKAIPTTTPTPRSKQIGVGVAIGIGTEITIVVHIRFLKNYLANRFNHATVTLNHIQLELMIVLSANCFSGCMLHVNPVEGRCRVGSVLQPEVH